MYMIYYNMLRYHMSQTFSRDSAPKVWKPTMERAREIRSSTQSSGAGGAGARRLSFTGPGHNFWREFLQEDVQREIQQVEIFHVDGDGIGSCSSVFFGKHGGNRETEFVDFFVGVEWGLNFLGEMSFGRFFFGGCYVDHKLVVESSEFKGWEKTDTVKLVACSWLPHIISSYVCNAINCSCTYGYSYRYGML